MLQSLSRSNCSIKKHLIFFMPEIFPDVNMDVQSFQSCRLLFLCSPLRDESTLDESTGGQCVTAEMSTEEHELLRLYQQSCGDEWVDVDLIMDLLHYICSTTCDGEILNSSGFENHSCLLSSVLHVSQPDFTVWVTLGHFKTVTFICLQVMSWFFFLDTMR